MPTKAELRELNMQAGTAAAASGGAASWTVVCEIAAAGGLLGLVFLALHGFGVEPWDLVGAWLRGCIWIAKRWEFWATFLSVFPLVVLVRSASQREAVALLWKLGLAGLLASGAVRGIAVSFEASSLAAIAIHTVWVSMVGMMVLRTIVFAD